MFKIFQIFIAGLFISLTMAGCAKSDATEANSGGDTDKIILTDLVTTSQGDIVIVGGTEQINATARFSDGATKDVTKISTWETEDSSIATVDTNGLVTGISEGNVTISVTYTEEEVTLTSTISMSVYATEPAFKSAKIIGDDYLSASYKTALNVYVTLDDDSVHHANDLVNWSSSDDSIATVDAYGVVYGKAEGNVTITATGKVDSSKTATHQMSIGHIPTGTIIANNIIWDFNDDLVLDRNNTRAKGKTGNNESNDKRYGVWYFHEVGYGFEKNQTVGETYFAFTATKAGNLNAVTVDVYLNDGTVFGNIKAKIDPSLSEPQEENLRYPTWADLRTAHPDWIIRANYAERGEKRLLKGNFFLRLGNSGYELQEPFEISKYIVVKVPEAGTIVKDNILWAQSGSIAIASDGKSASGLADGRAVWYYNEVGNGFVEGQKVADTSFEFAATGGNGPFVNVYITNGTVASNTTLRIGVDDPANNGYLTWNDVPSSFDNYTLRNWWQTTNPGKRVRGNFFLRIGDSTYTGSDAFTIDKFLVVHK